MHNKRSDLGASGRRILTAGVFVFLAGFVRVQACGVTDRQYIQNDNYNAAFFSNDYCDQEGDTYYSSNGYINENQEDVVAACEGICDILRPSIDCQGVVVKLMTGPSNPGTIGNQWQCDYYTSTLPPVMQQQSGCPSTPSSLIAVYRETINSCFASSSAVASDYCNWVYGNALPSPMTAYSTTVTLTATSSQSQTVTATVTVTDIAQSVSVKLLTATRTSQVSVPTTTSIVKVSAVVVSTVVVSKLNKVSTVFKAVTPTTTTTTTVCKALRALQARSPEAEVLVPRLTYAPPPDCLTTSGLVTAPSSLISSGCSCLFDTTTTFLATSTTGGIVTDTSTTTVTSTSVTVSTSVTTSDFVDATAYITALTTNTVFKTSTQRSTKRVTSISLTTSYSTVTKTATGVTKTVTTQVVKTAIPTFALFVRPAVNPGKIKYRLYDRKLESAADARVLQYSRNAGDSYDDYAGVNATIINGQLYVLSQSNNPKLYGAKTTISKGANAGRIVLGRQSSDDTASVLKGCTINTSTNVISCKTTDGKAAAWQELGWDSKSSSAAGGKLLLALIPSGGGSQYKPVMELVAGKTGSVQVGCT